MDDEESEKADEVMDVFDKMILNSYSKGMAKILKEIEKISFLYNIIKYMCIFANKNVIRI